MILKKEVNNAKKALNNWVCCACEDPSETCVNPHNKWWNNIVVLTGITKTQSITQNATINTSYVDRTDSYIIYTTGNSSYYPIIQSLKFFDCNLTAAIASGGTYITSPTYGYNSLANPCTNCRINIDYVTMGLWVLYIML